MPQLRAPGRREQSHLHDGLEEYDTAHMFNDLWEGDTSFNTGYPELDHEPERLSASGTSHPV